MARPERLFAAPPRILRCAPDRRRFAPASNLAEDDQVVELGSLSAGSSNHGVDR